MRDFGFYIYKTLYTIPENVEEVKEVKEKSEEKTDKKEAEKKDEKKEEKDKDTKDNNKDKKDEKRDERRDSRKRERRVTCNFFIFCFAPFTLCLKLCDLQQVRSKRSGFRMLVLKMVICDRLVVNSYCIGMNGVSPYLHFMLMSLARNLTVTTSVAALPAAAAEVWIYPRTHTSYYHSSISILRGAATLTGRTCRISS